MKRRILFTILLLLILTVSIYCGYYLSKKLSTKNSNNLEINIVNNSEIIDKNESDDKTELIEKIENEENNIEVVEKKNNSDFSASNKSLSKSTSDSSKSTSNSKSSNNSSEKETVKEVEDKKTTEIKEEPKKDDEKQEGKKEEVQTKTNEETTKTIEIVIEEPKESDYKNDPEYIKMKNELYSSKDECLKKGIDLSFSDSENIASTMCTSESYKGKEVGFRLYIRYKDGTYKEFKK